jgi:hypothetical protein
VADLLGEDRRPPLLSVGRPASPRMAAALPRQKLNDWCRVITRRICDEAVVFFLGADSNQAHSADRRASARPPTRAELASVLARGVKYDGPDPTNLSVVAQRFVENFDKHSLGAELQETLKQNFAAAPAHHFFATLPGLLRRKNCRSPYQLIVTTNYDDTLERSFRAVGESFDLVCYAPAHGSGQGKFRHFPDAGEPVAVDPSTYGGLPVNKLWALERTVILKLLGGVNDNQPEPFVVTEDDFSYHVAEERLFKELPLQLRAMLADGNLLLIGYGLEERDMKGLFRRLSLLLRQDVNYSSWAVQGAMPQADLNFWESNNVAALNVPLEDFFKALTECLEALPERGQR